MSGKIVISPVKMIKTKGFETGRGQKKRSKEGKKKSKKGKSEKECDVTCISSFMP